jgi:hypothetical protein
MKRKLAIFASVLALGATVLLASPLTHGPIVANATNCVADGTEHRASLFDQVTTVYANLAINYSVPDGFGGCWYAYRLTDSDSANTNVLAQPLSLRIWVCGQYQGDWQINLYAVAPSYDSPRFDYINKLYQPCGPQADDYAQALEPDGATAFVNPYVSF